MPDIFVDGVRAVAVANNVARIELLQVRRGADPTKLEPEVVATLLLPVAGLRELANHLTKSLQRIEAHNRSASTGAGATGEVESALENL